MAFATGSFWEVKNVTVPVSEEAFLFAVMITALQLVFGYMVGTAGSYINGKSVEGLLQFLYLFGKGEVNANSVNWRKLGALLTFVFLAVFDTYTDWQFSSRFGQPEILLIALVYSLLIYNIASEFALMYGLQLAIGNAPEAIVGTIKMLWATVAGLFGKKSPGQSQSKAPQGGSGSQQNKKPPQHQGGNNNHQKRPSGGAQQQRGNNNGHSGNPRRPPIEMPVMTIAMDEEGDHD
jgi:hypothetical protein